MPGNLRELRSASIEVWYLYKLYSIAPGGVVLLLYGQQCLNMSLKSPLPSFSPSEDSSETIIIWSYKRDAAASPKRTLWRLMTVHPTSINLKSLKNVIFQLLFFLRFPALSTMYQNSLFIAHPRDGHNRMNIYFLY